MESVMTKRSRIVLSPACLFLIFLAANSWLSGGENVSRSPGLESLSPRIAADSVGNFHVVWGEYVRDTTKGDAYYAKYDIVSQTWSTPLNLSNSGRVFSDEKRPVEIAIDSSDNIYVIYVSKNSVFLRIFSGGSWGAPFLLASWGAGQCDSARVGVDPLGNIFTCWWTLDNYTVYSRAKVDGVWENVQVISAGQSKFCDIAVGNNAVFACWSARYNTSVYQIFYVRRSTSLNAEWTAPRIMYAGSHKQQVPAVEVDSNDIAHIVFTPAFEQPGMRVVRYCRWTGTGFAAPVALSQQMVLHYPALDERALNLYVCWQVGAYGNGSRVDTNNQINATWTGVSAVPDSAGVTYCDVAVDPLGIDLYYVWDQGGEIWCNMGQTGSVPQNNDPPTAEFDFSPSTGIYPAEITFDASSSRDPDGSISSYSWDFGDGSLGSGMVVKHTYDRSGTFAVRLAVRDNGGATGVKTRNIEILGLFPPLNIRWVTKLDQSLLLSRNVNQVTWAQNPANDAYGVQITLYRIYRKKAEESDAAFRLCGEVTGSVYAFLDTDVDKNNVYVYSVTASDNQGHESPIVGGQGFSTAFEKRRASPFTVKRGRLTDRN
jgi:PKD repeat protein